jgi:hypothetical protein
MEMREVSDRRGTSALLRRYFGSLGRQNGTVPVPNNAALSQHANGSAAQITTEELAAIFLVFHDAMEMVERESEAWNEERL